jgi:Holliday junction resolvase-like predicted endonuclease
MRSYAARGQRDKAEPDVIDTLKRLGWSVLRVSVKNGPDLVASKAGRTCVIEVKTGKKALRPGQQHWVATWPGEARLLRTPEDVVAMDRER